MFGLDRTELLFLVLVAIAVGGVILALIFPYLVPAEGEDRVRNLVTNARSGEARRRPRTSQLIDNQKDKRRAKLQDTLKQIDDRARQKKGAVPLRLQISRAGYSISVARFWMISGAAGAVLYVLPLLFGFPWYIGVLSGIVGAFGLPRWFLLSAAKRRQKIFLEDLADAVDVMVRGLKAGLPLSDAMRVIATESGPPLGPEFMEVVEGQRLGVTIDQGLERMFDRVPLPEVSFLGIVISIQSKSGGNLSEALANLSRVLRERKKLKGKIRAMSQEARSSAAIIGSLPFVMVGTLLFMSPGFLDPLLYSSTGHMVLAGAGVWMLAGILMMRSMINFDI
ncbi:pilus assembly protein [Aestuariivirga litoralis]|uniref:Pilus assembly protein n=1 Tax=Aestuariivirga litoralis TaxID=2650924 RepID=A0A2W2CES2_9HYPH|nr:type II secretion system F family protein [Aestuariivirga litoralis]PZF78713.1 pilus assembly protein [Aestuariivirga litoralis]